MASLDSNSISSPSLDVANAGAVGRAYRTAVNASVGCADRGAVVNAFDIDDKNADSDAYV